MRLVLPRRRLLALAAAAPVVAACSGKRPSFASSDVIVLDGGRLETTTTTTVPVTTTTVDPETIDEAIVATATAPQVAAYDEPDAPEPRHVLDNPISSGGPLVFLVMERGDAWHKVLLPVRPNGSQGWVRAGDVTLSRHNYRMEVLLAEHTFRLYDHGELIFETRVAVARENAPTPGGLYYTTELLAPPNPDSVYGTRAYGLSGFSEVFTSFNGGPGQLGIHGTNDPSSIGTNASSGCIRMVNSDIEAISAFLPLGVPVSILT